MMFHRGPAIAELKETRAPRRSPSNAVLVTAVALGLLVAGVLLALSLFAPVITLAVDTSSGVQEDKAVVVPLRFRSTLLYRLLDDGPEAPASRLSLYEDGLRLGPPHSAHATVRSIGGGSYSHWGGHLYMSSSDGTDPRLNGRLYRAESPLSLRTAWLVAGWLGAMTSLLAGLALCHRDRRTRPLVDAAGRLLCLLGRPTEIHGRARAAVVTGASVVAVGIALALVVAGWFVGDATSSGAEVARFLPVSDAIGYHSCASLLASFAQLDQSSGADWCTRRILYTTLLASVLSVSGTDSAIALLVQGAFAGLATALFAARLVRHVGLAGSLTATAILFAYMWEFVLGLFMTEVIGFSLSLLGMALLLSFAETRRGWELFAGAAFVSVAMATRAGALFALPAIALWAWVFVATRPSFTWRYLLVSGVALGVGAALQVGIVWLLGADPSHTGSNFSASLYGLAIGSRDWTDAYRDFAPWFERGEKEAFAHIYTVALERIADRPGVLVAALADAQIDYFRSLYRIGILEPFNSTLTALAALGLVAAMVHARASPVARLLLLLAAAEVASASLIFDSGGVRIFASTIMVRAALCAAGIQFVILVVSGASLRGTWASRGAIPSTAHVAAALGGLVIAGMVLPVVFSSRLPSGGAVAAATCGDGLIGVVSRIGRESQFMSFTARQTMVESVAPFRVGLLRFEGDLRLKGSAIGADVLGVERPLTIIRAMDLSPESRSVRFRPLAYRGELEPSATPRVLCVDPAETVKFVNYPHEVIKEVLAVPGS